MANTPRRDSSAYTRDPDKRGLLHEDAGDDMYSLVSMTTQSSLLQVSTYKLRCAMALSGELRFSFHRDTYALGCHRLGA